MKTISLLFIMLSLTTALPQKPPEDSLVKITKTRIPMDKRLLSLCIGPEQVVGPHSTPEVDIYVNNAVIDYRKTNPTSFSYPVGSKFVKVKYSEVGGKEPVIATTMIKIKNSGSIEDWTFGMESLPDHKPIQAKGRISCASCHERYESRGFISQESETALQSYLRSADQTEKPEPGSR